MAYIAVLWFLVILIGIAAALNKFVTKAKFFNGAYVFLGLAVLVVPLQAVLAWSERRYEAAGAVFGYWLLPGVIAFLIGKRFAVDHPFSFPSVLWTKKSDVRDAQPADPATPTEDPPAITPSWMNSKKPWWK